MRSRGWNARLLLLLVAAEFVAEGGEELVAEVGFAAGAEAIEEGGAEDGGGDRFVDGGFDGPAAFAGVGDAAGELAQVWTFQEGGGGEVEEPGGDDAAATPDFGDVGEVEVVLVVLGVAEGRGFGVVDLAWFCRRWRGGGC